MPTPSSTVRRARRALPSNERRFLRVGIGALVFASMLSSAPSAHAAKKATKTPVVKKAATKKVVAKKVVAKKTPSKAVGTDTAPTPTTRPTPTETATTVEVPSTDTKLSFRACAYGMSCAIVAVPRDHRNPNGEKIQLSVLRREATDPTRRRGVVVVNPGGPGASTATFVRVADEIFGPDVRAVYDIIGVEPRGLGPEFANILRCPTPAVSQPTPPNEITRLVNEECGKANGKTLEYFDIESSARDIDAVRTALGEKQISFVGVSYGTYLGAAYRSLFPNNVARMVLDSAMDPKRFGSQMFIDPLAARDRALRAFFDACASGRLRPCAFGDGTDLVAKFVRVRERFITLRSEPDRGSSFDDIVSSHAANPRNGWPILGRALQEIETTGTVNFARTRDDAGDPTPPLTILDGVPFEVHRAMTCRDGVYAGTASDANLRTKSAAASPLFPTLADRVAGLAASCDGWAVAGRAALAIERSATPTLVVGYRLDVVTPFEWTESLATQLGAPVLLSDGGGHGAFPTDRCVNGHVTRFLLEGQLPAPGTTCA